MRIDLKAVQNFPDHLLEDLNNVVANVWSLAATDFYARYLAADAHGQKAPLGMQSTINRHLDSIMADNGWDASGGRFVKNNVWFRVTFRHGMSVGSDFMDALILAHRENFSALIIAAPSIEFAEVVTPRDFKAITTFDKLDQYFTRAQNLFPVPLAIGRLEQHGPIDPAIDQFLRQR